MINVDVSLDTLKNESKVVLVERSTMNQGVEHKSGNVMLPSIVQALPAGMDWRSCEILKCSIKQKPPELISEGCLFQRPAFLVAFAAFLVAFAALVAALVAAFVALVAAFVTFFASFVIFLAAFIILKINGCTKLSFLFIKDKLCLRQSQFYFNKQPNLQYAQVISADGWRKEVPGAGCVSVKTRAVKQEKTQ